MSIEERARRALNDALSDPKMLVEGLTQESRGYITLNRIPSSVIVPHVVALYRSAFLAGAEAMKEQCLSTALFLHGEGLMKDAIRRLDAQSLLSALEGEQNQK